jgi:hypothetical protein
VFGLAVGFIAHLQIVTAISYSKKKKDKASPVTGRGGP